MTVQIQQSTLSGLISAPASKSSMQRACAAALLAVGTTQIRNPGTSNDDKAALDVITSLGAGVVHNTDGTITISSNGVNPKNYEVNCGESGLGIRMFTPIAATSSKAITINGQGSLLTRPMHFFNDIFPLLGIKITSNLGKVPLHIQGPMQPKNIEVDGSLSSQFLTGLLMAYAITAKNLVTIKVNNLKSKPYIDLTLQVMKKFGVVVTHINHGLFTIKPSPHGFKPITYTVEGDWSGGAFLLVAGALAGPVTVQGLSMQSTQADKKIMDALQACGCFVTETTKGITVAPAPLQAFTFNATDCPDLFPPLVALAAHCNGITEISGVFRLAHKESDRGLTLQQEFAKLGIEVQLKGDTMYVTGKKANTGGTVHSRHDHRIAMACAVAGLKSDAPIIIEDAEAINKSYPDFYSHLQQLGAAVKINP